VNDVFIINKRAGRREGGRAGRHAPLAQATPAWGRHRQGTLHRRARPGYVAGSRQACSLRRWGVTLVAATHVDAAMMSSTTVATAPPAGCSGSDSDDDGAVLSVPPPWKPSLHTMEAARLVSTAAEMAPDLAPSAVRATAAVAAAPPAQVPPARKEKPRKNRPSAGVTCFDVKILCSILVGLVLLALLGGIVVRLFLPTRAASSRRRTPDFWRYAAAHPAAQLTSGSFPAKIKGKGAFVMFMSPYCDHCKAIKPLWDGLAAEFRESSSVLVGAVDCTVEKRLCSKHKATGYPIIKSFPLGGSTGKGTLYKG
jgi:thiol-disulfide isomerase/thioredoxin